MEGCGLSVRPSGAKLGARPEGVGLSYAGWIGEFGRNCFIWQVADVTWFSQRGCGGMPKWLVEVKPEESARQYRAFPPRAILVETSFLPAP